MLLYALKYAVLLWFKMYMLCCYGNILTCSVAMVK